MAASSLPNEVEQEEYNQANGVVTINTKELQELRKLVTDLKNNQLTLQANNNINNNNNNNNNNNKEKIWKYYWTHDACSHVGQDCKYNADGHEDTVTFSNRKCGSELRLKKANME